jgi:hypothetical protein
VLTAPADVNPAARSVNDAAADAFTHTDTVTGSGTSTTGAAVTSAVFATDPGCNAADAVVIVHFNTADPSTGDVCVASIATVPD